MKLRPKFKNEEAERAFWATHDLPDYFSPVKAQRVLFPNLKPSTESISLRLPYPLLAKIRELASSRDVPYQSLMKVFLAEKVRQEARLSSHT